MLIPLLWWILGIGAVGTGSLYLAKPELFSKEVARAKANEKANAGVNGAVQQKEGNAAASLVNIGIAADLGPDGPTKDYMDREVPLALSNLFAPSSAQLVAAANRRTAVMSGKFELADSLYKNETQKSAQLQAKLDKALKAQQEAQQAISEAAIANAAANRDKMMLIGLALVLGLLWVYSKVYGISLSTGGTILADIKAGADPVTAFDTHLAPWHHASVNKAVRLATPTK